MKLAGRHLDRRRAEGSAMNRESATEQNRLAAKEAAPRYYSPMSAVGAGAAARISPRARGGVLGLRLPDRDGGGAGDRVPQPAGRNHYASTSWTMARPRHWASTALDGQERFKATTEHAEEAARQRLRTGKTDLVVTVSEPTSSDGGRRFEYTYDPTQPKSVLARNTVDDVLRARRRPQGRGHRQRRAAR